MNPKFTLDDFRRSVQRLPELLRGGEVSTSKLAARMREHRRIRLRRLDKLISIMTDDERRSPETLGADRRARLAVESGVEQSDIDELLREFEAWREESTRVWNLSNLPISGFRQGVDESWDLG